MKKNLLEKGPCTESQAVTCILARLKAYEPYRKWDRQTYDRLVQFLKYVRYAQTEPPMIVLNEPQTTTLNYYTSYGSDIQISGQSVWCPHCCRLIPFDRVSRGHYRVTYINRFGFLCDTINQYVGLDCGHPLSTDTQDMETLITLLPMLPIVSPVKKFVYLD